MKELLSLLSSRFEAFTHPVTVTAPGVPGPPPLPDLEMLYGLKRSQMSLTLFTEGPLHRLAPFQPPSPESHEFHEQRLPRRYKVPEQHRAEGHKPTRPKEALQLETGFSLSCCLGTVCRLTLFLKVWIVLGWSDAVGDHLCDLNF